MAKKLTDSQIEEQQAQARRPARKNAKKGAAAREAFLNERAGFVDREALRTSLELLMASEDKNVDSEDADTIDTPTPLQDREVELGAPAPMAYPNSDIHRWNPIGPSAAFGQPNGSRVSGRVRDLAVSADGQRAYAGTAKGGVWYTEDGGSTWEPLGGWATRQGGNTAAFAVGCLLVHFGANKADDFVMVGTGEYPSKEASEAHWRANSKSGILAVSGPAAAKIDIDPWDEETGINVLQGLSINRMVRVPNSSPGQNGDKVIAATTGGLFSGTRSLVNGKLVFSWNPLLLNHNASDLVYVGNRLFICYASLSSDKPKNDPNDDTYDPTNFLIMYSDDDAKTLGGFVSGPTDAQGIPIIARGRMSIAVNDDNSGVYILGETVTNNKVKVPFIWKIIDPNGAPNAQSLNKVPKNELLWGDQWEYDQAIAVMTYKDQSTRTSIDRIFIGGSGLIMKDYNAALWAFDVVGLDLEPSPGVSDQPASDGGIAGLVGNGVHADIHCLRVAKNADGSSQLWVGCDGGVFVSLTNGQTNTFASRNVGLASLEAGFVACHPTSSHFAMIGCQDNGCQERVGDTVWRMKTGFWGDGGGVIFHPIQAQYVMGQYVNSWWRATSPESSYVPPAHHPTKDITPDFESNDSFSYSGIDAIAGHNADDARIALGTHRVWVTDNLATGRPNNTWQVLPITKEGGNPVKALDPRDKKTRVPKTGYKKFGVPTEDLGEVVTVKWVNTKTLLALYANGIVRYKESEPSMWTSSTLLVVSRKKVPVSAPTIASGTFFTDIAPVPGTDDFYLTGSGKIIDGVPPVRALDSCYYYASATGLFLTTGLRNALPVIDPAYSVVVDPANVNKVYVGTASGVWTATKDPTNKVHSNWIPFMNGLPESTVQDLKIWTDPAAGATSPRLLRAALQSRGVWEVDLATSASKPEPRRTYLRVHAFDDRRVLPTRMEDPRSSPSKQKILTAYGSPDIVVRPEAPVTKPPSYEGKYLTNGAFPYQLWTFQTAFRWLYPSVIPDGVWSDQFGDLVERHRRTLQTSSSQVVTDDVLWDSVMKQGKDEAGRLGVYRAPWQNKLAPALPGSEIDLMETVLPVNKQPRPVNKQPLWFDEISDLLDELESSGIGPLREWVVYKERSIVDILLHHRDTRPVPANEAFAVLLWRHHKDLDILLRQDCTNIALYVKSLREGAPVTPQGWNWEVASTGVSVLHRLSVPLAAPMPRAVSVNLDLSTIPDSHNVLMLAIAGSSVDLFSAAVPTGPLTSVSDFVRNWPHAAARVIKVITRPGTQLQ